MKTQGEIESAICERISRFEQDYMGRGPKDIHTHLLETARPVMETMVEEVTGIKVLSLHHDISRPSGRINANSVRAFHFVRTVARVIAVPFRLRNRSRWLTPQRFVW